MEVEHYIGCPSNPKDVRHTIFRGSEILSLLCQLRKISALTAEEPTAPQLHLRRLVLSQQSDELVFSRSRLRSKPSASCGASTLCKTCASRFPHGILVPGSVRDTLRHWAARCRGLTASLHAWRWAALIQHFLKSAAAIWDLPPKRLALGRQNFLLQGPSKTYRTGPAANMLEAG